MSSRIAARSLPDVGAHREVLLDGQRAEHAAAFGHHGETLAHELEGGTARHVLAGVADGAVLHRLQAGDALQRRRLAGAVGADQADELAAVDVEVDALDGVDAAVRDLDARELEQRVRVGRTAGAHECTAALSCALEVQQDLAAEVGGDHRRILLHFRRRSFGDLLAVVEHEHAVADAHHELHVVLDQQDRRAVAADVGEEPLERRRLGRVHSRRGLVEREQLRLGRERAGDLEAALVAVREVPGERVGALRDADVVEELVRALLDRLLLGARLRVAQDRAEARCRACARGGRSSRSRARRGSRRAGCSGTCGRCRARRLRSA